MPIPVVLVKTVDIELIVACRISWTMQWKIINFNRNNGPSAQQTKLKNGEAKKPKFAKFKGLHVLHFATFRYPAQKTVRQ